MTNQEVIKDVAIAFAGFVKSDCIDGVSGYYLRDLLDENEPYEYQIDELYDYWRAKIINS